jgi:hypothetical protein
VCPCPRVSLSCVPLCIPICVFGLLYFFTEVSCVDGMVCVFLRYFNRVKTGYDWNKYNQTHYDHDNPPPKSVQGYKFNIFYPDLIDRSRTPGYVLEPAVSACAPRSALCLWFRGREACRAYEV